MGSRALVSSFVKVFSKESIKGNPNISKPAHGAGLHKFFQEGKMKREFFHMNRYAVFLIFVFMVSISSLAQVTIKEKVEIKPNSGKEFYNYTAPQYTPCGPFIEENGLYFSQIIWNGSKFYIDPYQQLFLFQGCQLPEQECPPSLLQYLYYIFDCCQHDVEIIQGQQYCTIMKGDLYDPNVEPEIIGHYLGNANWDVLRGTGDRIMFGLRVLMNGKTLLNTIWYLTGMHLQVRKS